MTESGADRRQGPQKRPLSSFRVRIKQITSALLCRATVVRRRLSHLCSARIASGRIPPPRTARTEGPQTNPGKRSDIARHGPKPKKEAIGPSTQALRAHAAIAEAKHREHETATLPNAPRNDKPDDMRQKRLEKGEGNDTMPQRTKRIRNRSFISPLSRLTTINRARSD